MRSGAVSATNLNAAGRRLTGNFYLPADIGAAEVLSRQDLEVDDLADLCIPDGIYRGPIFKRIPAQGAANGRPYVAPAQLERLDIGVDRYLSKLHGDLLETLALRPGMICVSCSGMSLGKVIFVRSDMDGLVASHDLIRIRPDTQRIHPGYLFAYLSSRVGKLAIRRQIYGSSIRHIEPHHLFGLPVLRLGPESELQIGESILTAQQAISEGLTQIAAAQGRVHEDLGVSSEFAATTDEDWE